MILVGDEGAAASEEKPQFGDLFLARSKLAEVRPRPSPVGDDVGIPGMGFGLAAVGVAGSVYGEAGDVENPLIPFPQQRQQQRCATSRLIYRPDDLFRQEGDLIDELGDVRLVVFDLTGELLPPRSVQHVSPVKLLASIYSHPGFVHDHLHPSLSSSPSKYPADSSPRSDSARRSLLAVGASRGTEGRSSKAIERQAFSSHPRSPWASSRIYA
jgi:hypothetical protein